MTLYSIDSRSKLSKEEYNFYTGVGVVSTPVTFGYILSTVLENPACNTKSFWYGYHNIILTLLIGFLSISFASSIFFSLFAPLFLYIETLPDQSMAVKMSRHKAVSIVLVGSFAAIAAMSWYDFKNSYFCLSSSEVTIHTWFSGIKSYSWNEVASIESGCTDIKGKKYGEFYIYFKDQNNIKLAFQNQYNKPFSELQSTLEGIGYYYKTDSSVNLANCPEGIYALLTRWGRGL